MTSPRALVSGVAALVVLLVLGLLAAYVLGARHRESPGPESVTVTGSGKVTVVPDLLVVDLAVKVTRPTNAAALAEANAAQEKVTAALEDAGVATKDIRTTGFSVSPHYVYDKDGERQEGYDAEHTLRVYARDLDTAGKVLGDAVQAGGNAVRVQSTRLTLADKDEAMDDARADAVEDARSRASAYSDAAGRDLGTVRRISEHAATEGRVEAAAYDLLEARSGALDVPIEPGEQKLSVSVKVVFGLD